MTCIAILFWLSSAFAQGTSCKDYAFDHLVFFVTDSSAEHGLSSILTPGEKLATDHPEQGTSSRFFLLYNTYIEFIYLSDSAKVRANTKDFGSNYLERWNGTDSTCQLGVGMIMEPFDSNCSALHVYRSKDSPGYYLMEPSNANLSEVFIYASPETHQYHTIEAIEDLAAFHKPPYLADFEDYCQHPSGIQSLTRVQVVQPNDVELIDLNLLIGMDLFRYEQGKAFAYVLEFDHGRQGRSLRVSKWLEVRY